MQNTTNNTNTSMVTFGSPSLGSVVSTVNKSGKTTTMRPMRKKEFKALPEMVNKTSAEVSEAWEKHIRDIGQASTEGLAASLASGKFLVTRYSENKTAGRYNVSLVDKDKFAVTKKDSVKKEALVAENKKLQEQMALLMSRLEQLEKQGTAKPSKKAA